MFEIRDGSNVYNKVNRPTVVFDKDLSVLLKIGEYEDMLEHYNTVQKAYRDSGLHDIANDITLMELPKNQEEVDKVFQISNYVGVVYQKVKESVNNSPLRV